MAKKNTHGQYKTFGEGLNFEISNNYGKEKVGKKVRYCWKDSFVYLSFFQGYQFMHSLSLGTVKWPLQTVDTQ